MSELTDAFCTSCGTKAKEAANFCASCGAALNMKELQNPSTSAAPGQDRVCPKCGFETKTGAAKCVECGKGFPHAGPPPLASAPQTRWAERTFGAGEGGMLGCVTAAILLIGIVIALLQQSTSKTSIASVPPKQSSVDPATRERNESIDVRVEAEDNLRSALKDGGSAKLDGLFVSRVPGGGYALCGRVNAKNSFSAYTGFRRFVAPRNSTAPTFIDDGKHVFNQIYGQFCSNVAMRF